MLLALAFTSLAHADDPPDDGMEIVVEEDRVPAGTRQLDRDRIAQTPVRSTMELLRALPGMHLSAHGGRGKAWQFLYRGFDAEHGADLAVSVEGVPLNEDSHVHGHGYLDAGLLPDLLVRGVTLTAGVDRARPGPFAIAASVDMALGLEDPGLLVRLTGGTDRSGQLSMAWRPERAPASTFLVADVDVGAGVTDSRGWRHARVAGGLGHVWSEGEARMTVLAHDGWFDSPGALRADDVDAGRVGFYDGYDNAGDGETRRVLALGSVGWSRGPAHVDARAWGGARAIRLDQDFTGFLYDPVHGDADRQQERSETAGAAVEAGGTWRVADHPWRLDGGIEGVWRAVHQTDDLIDTAGVVHARASSGELIQAHVGAWSEAELGWAERVRVIPGVRLGAWHQTVSLEADAPTESRWIGTAAPRVRVEGLPHPRVTLFAGYGRGFRPPRASGGVLGALVTADNVQGGVAARPHERVQLTATAFHTRLDDEQVFDHASGQFLGAGATSRNGGELLVETWPVDVLQLDASVTFTDARFDASGALVPQAPRWTATLAATLLGLQLPVGALSGGLQAFLLGPRPLPLGFASGTGGTASARVGWTHDAVEVALQVDHLVGAPWRDGAFVYASDWDLDTPASQLPTLHATAGPPPAARLSVSVRI